MTSLLPSQARSSPADLRRDLRHRRPLVLLASLGGAIAAGATLVVCLAVGVVGWFLSDAGVHGTPSSGLRIGALGWLTGHGSGVHVGGTPVTALPLGVTVVCAWVVWRLGLRLGDSISGHGPDAARIADGERDWTVPVAAVLFTAGYVAVTVATATLAGTAASAPDTSRTGSWSVLLCLLIGAPAIAVGSGRAAIWTATLPASVVGVAAATRQVLRWWLLASLVAVVAAFLVDADTALNLQSQLGTDAGGTALVALVSVLVVPNAAIFGGSYLLGPGFTVGTGTLVSPSVVSIGALPMFPILAALPDTGPTPAWTPWLVAAAPLVAALAAMRAQRAHPTYRWEEGALHGCGGGMLAGLVFGLLAGLAGGAVGPGRMTDVGPLAMAVMLHGVVSFGVGGLVGGLVATGWQRRRRPTPDGQSLDSPLVHRTARLVVLVSGSGTNLQALLDATVDPAYGARVVAVGADREGIEGLERARRAGVPTFARRVKDFESRADWDAEMTRLVAEQEPDLVVLAGFMKLMGPAYLRALGSRTVNTHPALSPSFPGMHGPADALAYGVKVTGCTLFVIDDGVDTGPIVDQVAVRVEDDDSVETLHERIKRAERAMLVDAVGRLARNGFTIEDRKVRTP